MPDLHSLRADAPAAEWIEAYPVGNGLIGAMCHGGVETEEILLNHGTVWSGGPGPDPHPVDATTAHAAVREARMSMAAGDTARAEAALRRLQYAHPQSFLPLARLMRRSRTDASARGYSRTLDLRQAECRVETENLAQTVFASAPDGVLVVDVAGGDTAFDLDSPLRVERVESADGEILMICRAPDDVLPLWAASADAVRYDADPKGVRAAIAIRAIEGEATASAEHGSASLRVDGARAAVAIAVETTFVRTGQAPTRSIDDVVAAARGRARAAAARGVAELRERHRSAHRELYDRVALDLPADDVPEITTDRVAAVQLGETADAAADPSLIALLFHYGRYLLISSSRPGGVPANLQGIWNAQMQPPWSSNYTLNINLEMNYWLAEVTDLPEAVVPLRDYIEALARRGAPLAERVYGAPGWAAHHCSDVWGYDDPVGDGTHDLAWAFWPMAGAWLVTHLWERYRFGGDLDELRAAWPVIRGAAEFVLAWADERGGRLGFDLSTSPENRYLAADGEAFALAPDATMDLVLARNLMSIVADAAEALGETDELTGRAVAARELFPEPSIGAGGLVQEWRGIDALEDPQHRHMAHLVYVHPLDGEPTGPLADAARRSLDVRGDESTGWSLAWKIAMRARLHEPAAIERLLDLFVRSTRDNRHVAGAGSWRGGLYPNLFAAHPPFQIDGNLGIVAAVAECLLQSHRGSLELLPAVPAALAAGSVRGLRARGSFAVDLEWEAGRVLRARIENRGGAERTVRIEAHGRTHRHTLAAGAACDLTAADIDSWEEAR